MINQVDSNNDTETEISANSDMACYLCFVGRTLFDGLLVGWL